MIKYIVAKIRLILAGKRAERLDVWLNRYGHYGKSALEKDDLLKGDRMEPFKLQYLRRSGKYPNQA